ncbi:MAG: ribosome recycling factor [Candidatus Levybacteria bacterium RIFCSPHIGHO2_12_FULL_38_12]|nr:MAG: ribosome recycling factor [Candidatus Levybacteria bacterium RIFCSPHIGHO2_01_FULL_38_12]OGH22145.1 MAG: ribosome recycling factor [Candidatus Levybacteria bacterium RIFCSPHIGHO2_02_FULL_37_18]OGH22992.1 MAG: ribosome recycling factor [Candidatus Levybacteria bacterium RIFCSPHIGHO2_12_FULL_38_12]OGH44956.1 MAG: ribosome recycling factor [Candidatus Levybacteria bacterium RIFCSPLOWO2_02_FULL_37_18]OGH50529.1 MAG: ribosome recycling factor [Candidatus Levybacteria bacterium RIFCSPLOWO2_12_
MDPLDEEVKAKLAKVLEVLKTDISTVRTGRATPGLVDHVVVSVYGGSTRMKIMELATIGVQDNQTILITPFDQSIIGEIQKGIMEANIGLTPVIDGQNIRISIPQLSEERRQQLIHLMRQKLENGKIMTRHVRQEAMTAIKKDYANKDISEDIMLRLEKEVQRVVDEVTSEIETLGKKKEEELLQI